MVHPLEWCEPSPGDAALGLEHCAGRALPEAIRAVRGPGTARPWIVAHSLGGTLAVVATLLDPEPVEGLVLLHAPLSFAPGSSPFRDALVHLARALDGRPDLVPGSLLGFLAATAAPATFWAQRIADALACAGDAEAFHRHLLVERWTLDEIALPGALVRDVWERLWARDALCRGTLQLAGRRLDPGDLARPLLAISSPQDAIAPPAAVRPFLERARVCETRLVRWPAEPGTVFAHLAAALGRRAHARLWPRVAAWMRSRGATIARPSVQR